MSASPEIVFGGAKLTSEMLLTRMLITGGTSEKRLGVIVELVEQTALLNIHAVVADSSGNMAVLADHLRDSKGIPCALWSPIDADAIKLRFTCTDLGPLIISELIGAGAEVAALEEVFKFADRERLLLIDIGDLLSVLRYGLSPEGNRSMDVTTEAIERLIVKVHDFSEIVGDNTLGEPALDFNDFYVSNSGQGCLNVIDLSALDANNQLCQGMELSLLSEAIEDVPVDTGALCTRLLLILTNCDHLLQLPESSQLSQKFIIALNLLAARGISVILSAQKDIEDDSHFSKHICIRITVDPPPGESQEAQAISVFTPQTRAPAVDANREFVRTNPFFEKYRLKQDRESAEEQFEKRAIAAQALKAEEFHEIEERVQVGAASIEGIVTEVADGDTLTLTTSQQIKLRLFGVDAPEASQALGMVARDHLATLVLNKRVTVEVVGGGMYGRVAGRVYVDGIDVNLAMITAGLAWYYSEYAEDAVDLAEAQEDARRNGRGIWHGPVPPWEYRKSTRGGGGLSGSAQLVDRQTQMGRAATERERKRWVDWGLRTVGGVVLRRLVRGVLGGRKR